MVAFHFDAGLHRLKLDPQQVNQVVAIKSNQPIRKIQLSPDGAKLAGSLASTQGVVWDWSTGKETARDGINVFFPAQYSPGYFTMGQQGTRLFIAKNEWKKPTSTKVQTYSLRRPVVLPALGYLSGFKETPRSEAYYVVPGSLAVNESRAELYCVVIDTLDGIRIQTIDLSAQKRTHNVLFKRPSNPQPLALAPSAITNDGKRFAIVESQCLKVIDVESKETIFEKQVQDAVHLMFSKDRDWLAMVTKRGVTVFGPDSGDVLEKIREPDALVAYAFDADQLLVASPQPRGRVRIFDTKTWRQTLEHKTDTAQRVDASISHDGRRVAFALDNCRLELWDVDELKR